MYGRRLHTARGAALAGGLVLLLASTGHVLLRYRVYAAPTASMYPLITPGDRIVVDTWSQDAARSDVVLLDGENLLVKRIAATGGETIACCDHAGAITTGQVTAGAGTTPFTVRVTEGHLFVLGDNAAASLDSRAAALTRTAGAFVVAIGLLLTAGLLTLVAAVGRIRPPGRPKRRSGRPSRSPPGA